MIHESIEQTAYRSRGGRSSSSWHRQLQSQCEDFEGLEEGVDRYELLLLVKKTAKLIGIGAKALHLLDYYMAFTNECDWEEGARPIVYKALTKTALDLGVSERQIQRLEKELFDAGALTWNDSGNHRRYGQRCPETGKILYGFGVDLSPLAYLKPKLQERLYEDQLRVAAWAETKRQISWYRAQVRSLIADLKEGEQGPWQLQYETVAVPIRTHMCLQRLRDLLKRHKSLYEELSAQFKRGSEPKEEEVMSQNTSSMDATDVAHIQNTNQESFNEIESSGPAAQGLQGGLPETSDPEEQDAGQGADACILEAAGLGEISIGQVVAAASHRFKTYLPNPTDPSVSDLIDAAYQLRRDLHISQQNWKYACDEFSRMGAALCILITDQAAYRPENPVRIPAAYFKTLIKKAEARELNVHASILAILKREEGPNGT